ncbi:MAG TPA: efflux RND transporter periplasmic adaptor subunit [Gemmatimonadaceae bacterium]|jgi:RND family efflux transporter MFP subunit|nr:efflux RND transporter periplasmic adaptor subunit [Gemmatimonadaceae bacterium]
MTVANMQKSRGMPHWIWWLAGVVLVIAGVVIYQQYLKNHPKVPGGVTDVANVGKEGIVVTSNGEIRSGPPISGTMTPQQAATLRSEISGPVVQTYVEQGQSVKRGQSLVRIDDMSQRDALLSAQSAVRSAKLTLDNATRDAEREQRLETAGAVAPRDVEAAQRTLASAQAGMADAQSRLTAAQQQVDKASFRAPFDGLVSERPVNAGDVVQPGAAIVSVVNPASMRLEGSVPAEQLSSLKIGTPVIFTVNGYGAQTFTGRIDRINPTADPATRQVRVYVTIPNEKSALVGGLFADGRVSTETRQGILVPVSAVDERGITAVVLRIKGGVVERVPVQLGVRDNASEQVELRSGVTVGDTLLVNAAQGLAPGTKVRITTVGDQPAGTR